MNHDRNQHKAWHESLQITTNHDMNHHDDPKRALHKAIWLPCWYCFLSFVLFLISTVCELFFSEEVSCFRLRYFHFVRSIGISFLVWYFLFIVKYVLFLILLPFICFVFDFNCLWTILFWRSILFQIVRYFHFARSIGISFLVWSF